MHEWLYRAWTAALRSSKSRSKDERPCPPATALEMRAFCKGHLRAIVHTYPLLPQMQVSGKGHLYLRLEYLGGRIREVGKFVPISMPIDA